MTQDELKNEAQIRRFLLGEMPEAERVAFEERFVAADDFFGQVLVAEDELIESYVRGTLAASEKTKFERGFLTAERRRARVAFTRAMIGKLTEDKEIAAVKKTGTAAAASSVRDLITNLFKVPSLTFGAVSAILLTVLGGWFLIGNSSDQEVARQSDPAPTATAETIQTNSNQFTRSNQTNSADSNLKTPAANRTNANVSRQKNAAPNANANNQKTEPAAAVNPVLALFAGTVRSGGKTGELNLPVGAKTVSLQLNLESSDYKIYRAEIVNEGGAVVARNNKLRAANSKIDFFVPAAKLARGDYIVKLFALNPQNETESVADYAFRVNRK